MSDLNDRIRKIIVDHLNVDEAAVTDTANFQTDLNADSLDQVELVMAFEEEFGIEVLDEEAEKILTFADAKALIEKKTKAAA